MCTKNLLYLFSLSFYKYIVRDYPKYTVQTSLSETIEIRLYRKGTYILADIHGMDHFCTKLAPPSYNKPRSCVSKIHTPMVMVWFGNV
jgi:hypothetical protein